MWDVLDALIKTSKVGASRVVTLGIKLYTILLVNLHMLKFGIPKYRNIGIQKYKSIGTLIF